MQTGLNARPIPEVIADALVLMAFEGEAPKLGLSPDGWISRLYESGEFTGELRSSALLHQPDGLKAPRLALAGCGKRDDFDLAELRRVAGAVVRRLSSRAVRRIALVLDPAWQITDAVEAAIEGGMLGAYEPDRYKTDEKKSEAKLESFAVVASGGDAELSDSAARGRIVAASQNFSRDLAYEPGNQLTPNELAHRARLTAAEFSLACDVLDRDRMEQLGMGALLGVARGSAEPPVLIVLRYEPEQTANGDARLALIGKGVTFDTGGISIKPSQAMDEMKYDMSGGAAVLGAMRAIAQLKPPVPVTALIPAVENMPGGRAQRPGDIVTTLSGKTVEVLNTDAEGRMILVDAITYAKRLGCTHLVDAATLTGSIVVALGHVHVGAFTNHQVLLDRVLAAASATGEKMWQMPLDDDYKEGLKSPFADLPNIGPRWGGAITAAYFLKEFADPAPWVHLDIAGTAWLEEAKPFLAKGPTGVPVRTLIRLATDWR